MHSSQHDKEPRQPISIEEWVLTDFGYAHVLGKPIPEISPSGKTGVLAEDFLDAYPAYSPHRQDTEDLLEWYREADPADPDYSAIRDDISRYLEVQFGPPSPEAQDTH